MCRDVTFYSEITVISRSNRQYHINVMHL